MKNPTLHQMTPHTVLFGMCLFLLLVMLWKWYWTVQILYNPSSISLYTPDTFTFDTEEEERKYEETVDLGIDYAKTKRVVIASLVRDVEPRLPEIIKKAERVGRLFSDYRIVIVENDSKDDTRKLLLGWASRNPKVTILGCGINAKECSLPKAPKTDGHYVDRTRIQKMVDLRNIYLDHVKQYYSEYDYVVMWDLDMIGSVYLDGIQHSLGYLSQHHDVDVVCAYGIYHWAFFTLFYDTYALLHRREKFHIDHKTIHDIRKGMWEAKYSRGNEPVEVDSCFSGFAVYRTASLLNDAVKYDMSPPNNLECEHVRLNKKIRGKKVVNPSMINLVLLND